MINIDVLTVGNEFKNADGDIFKVTGNVADDKEILITLKKVEELEQPIFD